MKRNNLKLNFIFQMIYKFLVLVTPLITAPYIARVIGVESLGVYSYSLSVVGYFVMVAYLGIDNYGCKTIAQTQNEGKEKIKGTFSELFTMQLCSGLVALAGFVVFFFIKSKEYYLLYIVQGIAILTAIIEINWFFVGNERFTVVVSINIVVKIATVLSILFFVKSAKDLILYALIMVGGSALTQVVMWVIFIKEYGFIKLNFKGSLKHFKPNLILFIPALSLSVFHNMDKTMLGLLSDYANTGYYYNVDKVINMPLGLITGLSLVMLPRMAHIVKYSTKEDAISSLGKYFELTCFLAASMTFGIIAVSNEFVPLFFGPGYEPCVLLAKFFAPLLIIKSFSDLIQMQVLIPNNKEKYFIIATICGAITNLVLNFLLIPPLGALGATIATLVAELVVLLTETVFISKIIGFWRIFIKNSAYFVVGGIMLVLVSIVSGYLNFSSTFAKLIVEIAIGVAVYFALMIPYWLINKTSIFHRYLKRN